MRSPVSSKFDDDVSMSSFTLNVMFLSKKWIQTALNFPKTLNECNKAISFDEKYPSKKYVEAMILTINVKDTKC